MSEDMESNHSIMCNLMSGIVREQYEKEDRHKRAKGVKTLLFPIDSKAYQLIYVTHNRVFGILLFPNRKEHKSERYYNINLKFQQ